MVNLKTVLTFCIFFSFSKAFSSHSLNFFHPQDNENLLRVISEVGNFFKKRSLTRRDYKNTVMGSLERLLKKEKEALTIHQTFSNPHYFLRDYYYSRYEKNFEKLIFFLQFLRMSPWFVDGRLFLERHFKSFSEVGFSLPQLLIRTFNEVESISRQSGCQGCRQNICPSCRDVKFLQKSCLLSAALLTGADPCYLKTRFFWVNHLKIDSSSEPSYHPPTLCSKSDLDLLEENFRYYPKILDTLKPLYNLPQLDLLY